MKHSMTAVVALVLGLGVAATVHAQSTDKTSAAPTASPPSATTNTPPADTASTPPAAPAQPQMTPAPKMTPQASDSNGPPQRMRSTRTLASRNDVKQAQEQLKAAGLYRGKIDGINSRATKAAILRFQHRNGLRLTATLTRSTMDRLMGSSTAGVGSSMPSGSNRITSHTHKMVPPPTNAAGNGAGGTAAPNNLPNQQQ